MIPKHKAFADEYLANGMNGAEAYRTIYKVKKTSTAEVNASRLLSNAKVKEYIEEKQKAIGEKLDITKEKYIKQLDMIITITALRDPRVAVQAIAQISKMQGYDAPSKSLVANVSVKDILAELKDEKDVYED